MQYRALGREGLSVSALGLGTMGMTMASGPADEREGVATIRRAHELGATFFDTAELYGQGTGSNEMLLGRAVASFRDEIVIATKFGFDLSRTRLSRVDSRPEHIVEVADNSLRYLGATTSTCSTVAWIVGVARHKLVDHRRVDPSMSVNKKVTVPDGALTPEASHGNRPAAQLSRRAAWNIMSGYT